MRVMKAAVLMIGLIAAAFPAAAPAQPADVCTACVADARCGSREQSCVAECQAGYFFVDPRRSECTARCSSNQTQCERTAVSRCRSQEVCR
jgi:hypothetical protein